MAAFRNLDRTDCVPRTPPNTKTVKKYGLSIGRAPVLAGHEENTLGSVQPSLECRSISINIHPTNNRPGPAVLLVASAAHTKRKKATRRPMGRANSPDR